MIIILNKAINMTNKSEKSITKTFAAAALAASLSTAAFAADRTINFSYKNHPSYSGLVNCDLLQKKTDPYPSEATCPFLVEVDNMNKGMRYTCPTDVTPHSPKALQGIYAHRRDAHGIAAFQSINFDANVLRKAGYSPEKTRNIIKKTTTQKKIEVYYLGRVVDHYKKQGLSGDALHNQVEQIKSQQGWSVSTDRFADGSYKKLYDPGQDARQQCLNTYPDLRP